MFEKGEVVPIPMIAAEPIPVNIDEDDVRATGSIPSTYGSIEAEAAPLIVVDDESDLSKGTNGIVLFRDPAFAILFILHFVVVIWLAVSFGSFHIDEINLNVTTWKDYVDDDATDQLDDNNWSEIQKFVDDTIHWLDIYPSRIFSFVIIPSCLSAFGCSFVLTALAIPSCPFAAVKFSLLGTLAMALIVALSLSVAAQFNIFLVLLSTFLVGLVVYYVWIAWRVIPFAAVNLSIALQGISENCGVYLVAFLFSIIGFIWTVLWIYILVGVMDTLDKSYEAANPQQGGMSNNEYSEGKESDPLHGLVFFSLLISLYWTSKVLLVGFFFISFLSYVFTNREISRMWSRFQLQASWQRGVLLRPMPRDVAHLAYIALCFVPLLFLSVQYAWDLSLKPSLRGSVFYCNQHVTRAAKIRVKVVGLLLFVF